jgi:hypothetical protein
MQSVALYMGIKRGSTRGRDRKDDIHCQGTELSSDAAHDIQYRVYGSVSQNVIQGPPVVHGGFRRSADIRRRSEEEILAKIVSDT